MPSSNENNVIYLRSSEWGGEGGGTIKNNKFQVVASCALKSRG